MSRVQILPNVLIRYNWVKITSRVTRTSIPTNKNGKVSKGELLSRSNSVSEKLTARDYPQLSRAWMRASNEAAKYGAGKRAREKCGHGSFAPENRAIRLAGCVSRFEPHRWNREMHSPLNVSRQPLCKRDKSRGGVPPAILSRRISRRRRRHWCRCRRRCSGIKYPIESLIRLQTRPILGHLFAPTAMFAPRAPGRDRRDRYFSAARSSA